ncbi:hypothetical protein K438DRAFT_1749286 [Mycena galopus ATCC 62051]|nr:hypothetical protein K438DRAFT_1749286 [Mycena galopus ATCC 62051]
MPYQIEDKPLKVFQSMLDWKRKYPNLRVTRRARANKRKYPERYLKLGAEEIRRINGWNMRPENNGKVPESQNRGRTHQTTPEHQNAGWGSVKALTVANRKSLQSVAKRKLPYGVSEDGIMSERPESSHNPKHDHEAWKRWVGGRRMNQLEEKQAPEGRKKCRKFRTIAKADLPQGMTRENAEVGYSGSSNGWRSSEGNRCSAEKPRMSGGSEKWQSRKPEGLGTEVAKGPNPTKDSEERDQNLKDSEPTKVLRK